MCIYIYYIIVADIRSNIGFLQISTEYVVRWDPNLMNGIIRIPVRWNPNLFLFLLFYIPFLC